MAYEEYTWQTGETITAAKLNHMEEGIASSEQIVQFEATYDDLGDTWTIETDIDPEDIVELYLGGSLVTLVGYASGYSVRLNVVNGSNDDGITFRATGFYTDGENQNYKVMLSYDSLYGSSLHMEEMYIDPHIAMILYASINGGGLWSSIPYAFDTLHNYTVTKPILIYGPVGDGGFRYLYSVFYVGDDVLYAARFDAEPVAPNDTTTKDEKYLYIEKVEPSGAAKFSWTHTESSPE